MGALNGCGTGGAAYAARSDSARGRLRRGLVGRRLLTELPGRPVTVLDAGCGNGEMPLRVDRVLRLEPGQRHLELGPGPGISLAVTGPRLAAGAERDGHMASFARRNPGRLGPGVAVSRRAARPGVTPEAVPVLVVMVGDVDSPVPLDLGAGAGAGAGELPAAHRTARVDMVDEDRSEGDVRQLPEQHGEDGGGHVGDTGCTVLSARRPGGGT
ncbi:hypothetical protein GCM10010275_14530 [Streptomyces litmocidini]|uniref:hypothetical protein n=1 Tax=Streptomyces litmocidini TaxID=67318 RepID=UPI0019B279CF|nr:hypothetical protein [Streptomyces litmocidini]GGU80812.1 hypothetical protein GCM10010275_14530 [Streptomyces litmocidini]